MHGLGAHVECRCSRACGADVTIRDVTIKTPDRKWTGTWMTSCPEATRWGFWDLKKAVSWYSSLEEGRRFLVSPRGDQLGSTESAARLLKKLCLSLLMSKNLKLKKVIKSFVPEPISCFSDSYVYEHLWTFSVSVWICIYLYSYLGRIFLDLDMIWETYFFVF